MEIVAGVILGLLAFSFVEYWVHRLGHMDIPDTLNATLTRRLEHLGIAKEVAQIASVISW